MMQSIIKVRNHILIVTLILLSLSAKAQCTWSNYYYESFEYNTVIPYIIPGTTYQNTPQTYAGCVHAGSNGMYLNIVDGVTGLIYDQPFTGLCVGREYQFSLWTRDAFTSSNNLTFQVLNASNTIISSQTVITNSIWMNVNLPVFTANSSNIRFQIITNIPGTGGNDAGIDEISLAICTPTPSNYSLIQCAALGNVNLYSQITSGLSTNGVWSGPSTLQNGYQGTFVPGTNTNGTYTYTIDAGGTCPDSIATVQVNLQNTPDINPLGPIAACSSYTLPVITGTGLSGNQHYYTGPNGTGSILNTGTSITSSQTIYMYAGTTGCSDNEVVEITISTPVTAGLDDQVNYCSSGQTINMNSFLSAGATTGGIWSETTVPPSGTFNSTNANWITNSSTSGTYTFSYTVPANGSCPSDIANFSIFIGSQNGLDLGNDTILCQGETIDFTVPPGYDYFSWNVTNGNPTTITVSSPTTVILETQNTTGNLVVNGDFESGNSGFSTGYGPGTGGSFGLLTNSSTYAVTTNPNSVHTNFVNCADVTPNGPGNMMVVNGSTTPNTQVWGQTVSINPNTNYNFSVWASSVENINVTDLAQLQFYINNVQVGSVFSPTLLGCDWQQFFETWNSGTATSANISIVAQAISGNNDFAIDDISFNSVCIQRDTVVVNYSTEEIDAGSDLAFCANESEALTATANYPNPNFTWETGVTNATITPTTSGYFTVSAISPSGCFLSDSALVTITPMPWDFDIVDSQPTSCGVNSGAVFAVMNGTFNDPPYYTWNGPGANNPNSVDASVWQNLSSGWYYIQVESAGCYRYDSVFVDVSNPPVAGIGATPLTGDAPLNVNFTNSSTNATSYVWNFGNGNTVNASDLSGQQQTYTDPGVYTAYIVAEQGNCDDTAFVTIIVNVPPVPPIPPVIVPVNLSYPNVFTPNGDATNDFFEFDLLNIKEIEVYVVNRWGETVFSSSDVNFKWDGKINGKLATEGVYTFVYKATGAQNENLEGQGFVHLIY